MSMLDEYEFPRFMNFPSTMEGRRKWHERYLKRFEQLEGQPNFKVDCEKLREHLEASSFANEAINYGGSALLTKYGLHPSLIDFIIGYVADGTKDYKMIYPPAIIQINEQYEKDANHYYKTLDMSMTRRVTRAELRDYLDDEWDADLKFFLDQLPPEDPLTRFRPAEDKAIRVVELTKQGMSSFDIANELEIDADYVRRIRGQKRNEGYEV